MALPEILRKNVRVPVVAAPLFIISHPPLGGGAVQGGRRRFVSGAQRAPRAPLDDWLAASPKNSPLRRERTRSVRRRLLPSTRSCTNRMTASSTTFSCASNTKCRWSFPRSARRGGRTRRCTLTAASCCTTSSTIVRPKAIEKGADGLIAVAAGAGGHAGTLSPFALVQEVRELVRRAAAAFGRHRDRPRDLAARAMGADLAYIGSRLHCDGRSAGGRRL